MPCYWSRKFTFFFCDLIVDTLFSIINLSSIFTVNDEVISSIGQGICVFIGISSSDSKKDMEYM